MDNAEIIIISCPHDTFLNIDFLQCKKLKYIFDCYNKLDKNKFYNTGIQYIGVGGITLLYTELKGIKL